MDKVFFKDLEQNERARIIIETIIKMCKRLQIKTVAEGIETKGQMNFLKQVECDVVQGFYFSKPLMVQEFEEKFLKNMEKL